MVRALGISPSPITASARAKAAAAPRSGKLQGGVVASTEMRKLSERFSDGTRNRAPRKVGVLRSAGLNSLGLEEISMAGLLSSSAGKFPGLLWRSLAAGDPPTWLAASQIAGELGASTLLSDVPLPHAAPCMWLRYSGDCTLSPRKGDAAVDCKASSGSCCRASCADWNAVVAFESAVRDCEPPMGRALRCAAVARSCGLRGLPCRLQRLASISGTLRSRACSAAEAGPAAGFGVTDFLAGRRNSLCPSFGGWLGARPGVIARCTLGERQASAPGVVPVGEWRRRLLRRRPAPVAGMVAREGFGPWGFEGCGWETGVPAAGSCTSLSGLRNGAVACCLTAGKKMVRRHIIMLVVRLKKRRTECTRNELPAFCMTRKWRQGTRKFVSGYLHLSCVS